MTNESLQAIISQTMPDIEHVLRHRTERLGRYTPEGVVEFSYGFFRREKGKYAEKTTPDWTAIAQLQRKASWVEQEGIPVEERERRRNNLQQEMEEALGPYARRARIALLTDPFQLEVSQTAVESKYMVGRYVRMEGESLDPVRVAVSTAKPSEWTLTERRSGQKELTEDEVAQILLHAADVSKAIEGGIDRAVGAAALKRLHSELVISRQSVARAMRIDPGDTFVDTTPTILELIRLTRSRQRTLDE